MYDKENSKLELLKEKEAIAYKEKMFHM